MNKEVLSRKETFRVTILNKQPTGPLEQTVSNCRLVEKCQPSVKS